MSISNTLQNLTSGVLAACAVTAVVILVRGNQTSRSTASSGRPVAVERWDELVRSGRRMGPVDAKVVVVEFADFECPVCRTFMSTTMVPFLRDHPDEAALVFRHWPLSYHRFAYPAARASECAAAQGRFVTYHDLLYEYQDSLGLKPFREMAQEAGVLELAQFDECIARTEQVTRIEDDIAEAQTRGGSGTPTIFVNGYRYLGMPTRQQLDSILDVARMGANQ